VDAAEYFAGSKGGKTGLSYDSMDGEISAGITPTGARKSSVALTAAGGTFLARGMPAAVKESGKMQRTVLIQFDSLQAALAAYDSAGYQEAMRELGNNAVVRDIRIIEGV
jgi:uncharacterized protein (DUF1330 family)